MLRGTAGPPPPPALDSPEYTAAFHEVKAVGETITLWVNGAVTCRFEDCGKDKGYLGLEGEGYRIEFRNLKVKSLD